MADEPAAWCFEGRFGQLFWCWALYVALPLLLFVL